MTTSNKDNNGPVKKNILDYLKRLDALLREDNKKMALFTFDGKYASVTYDNDSSSKEVVDRFDSDDRYAQKLIAKVGEEHGVSSDWLSKGLETIVGMMLTKQCSDNLKITVPGLTNMIILTGIIKKQEDVGIVLKFFTLRGADSTDDFMDYIENIDKEKMVQNCLIDSTEE